MNRTTTHDDILRRVTLELDDRRDGILPMQLAGVSEHFDDATALVGALQLRWHSTLSGLIERELAGHPMDRADAVVAAWAQARQAHPGVRAALDAAAAHPADGEMAGNLRRAAVKEHTLLAAAAGQAGLADPRGPRLGARLEQRARALETDAPAPAPPTDRPRQAGTRVRRNGLAGRVRHLVA